MVDSLAELYNVQVQPSETGWGTALQAFSQAAPALYSPYASSGQNFATAAGAALMAGLLGFQARQSAEQQTAELAQPLQQLLKARTAEELGAVAGAENFPSRLNPLAQSLMLNQYMQQQKANVAQAALMAELEGRADFELGPKGTALFKRKSQEEAIRQAAITSGFEARQRLEDKLIRERLVQRKELGLQDVDIPQAILNRAIEKNASSDLALEIAQAIDTYKSIPKFAAAKSISAFGDDQLKSRLRNLSTVVLQSRSGLAATDKERTNLQKILTGDFTAVNPETVSAILKRFANDEKTIAADTVAAATQRPEAFVGELRKALQEGRQTTFEPRIPSYGIPKAVLPVTTPTVSQPTQIDQKLETLRQLQAELAALKAARGG